MKAPSDQRALAAVTFNRTLYRLAKILPIEVYEAMKTLSDTLSSLLLHHVLLICTGNETNPKLEEEVRLAFGEAEKLAKFIKEGFDAQTTD